MKKVRIIKPMVLKYGVLFHFLEDIKTFQGDHYNVPISANAEFIAHERINQDYYTICDSTDHFIGVFKKEYFEEGGKDEN